MVIVEPAAKLLPLAGLVMEITDDDEEEITVTVTALDVVETPLASVATAVKL